MSLFTTSEIELIEKQILEPNLRPAYYSAEIQNYVVISEDFESYLILQDKEQKQKGLDWIKAAEEFELQKKDHDEIYKEYLEIRAEDAEARIEDLDDKLNKYIEYQSGVLTDGNDPSRFASINEVNVMMRSLSRGITNIKILREAAFHEQTMVNILSYELEQEETNKETTTELKSWQIVLSAYKGQDSKSGVSQDKGTSLLG